MNERQFRYVVALAEKGSFSRAAEVLNVSQPSLSQYIKRIENEVGMRLFERTGGNVRLTGIGKDRLRGCWNRSDPMPVSDAGNCETVWKSVSRYASGHQGAVYRRAVGRC